MTCNDYLLIHEMRHLKVPHHGAAFWRLLDRCIPDGGRWMRWSDEVEV